MGSETSKVAEALVKAQDRIAELEATIAHLREVAAEQHAWEEMAERCGLPLKPEAAGVNVMELREAVRLLGTRIRVGSDLHDFMVTEYSQRDKDRKAMNRKRARMKTALFVACDEVEANPIAAAAVREAGR